MTDTSTTQQNSPGWLFFVRASFVLAFLATAAGIFCLPGGLWVKGYCAMGVLYLMGSTFMLSKTLRDEFEARKLVNKIADARTEKILKEYDLEPDVV